MIETLTYRGWPDALRLTNGLVEAVVVPSVARIMRWGFVGGPNLLYENLAVAGKPIPLNTWLNTGGDKVWPWPQSDWPRLLGRDWPPPPGADQQPQTAEALAPDTIKLVSPRVVPWGLRIERTLTLPAGASDLHVTSRFVAYRDHADPLSVGVWTITQVPVGAGVVWVRLLPSSPLPGGTKTLMDGRLPTRPVAGNRLLRVERDPASSAKIGIDADALAVAQGDTLFVVRPRSEPPPTDNRGAGYQPGEIAQIYAQPDDPRAAAQGTPPYIELERTSPRKPLRAGDTLTLDLLWQARRAPTGSWGDAEVAALLR